MKRSKPCGMPSITSKPRRMTLTAIASRQSSTSIGPSAKRRFANRKDSRDYEYGRQRGLDAAFGVFTVSARRWLRSLLPADRVSNRSSDAKHIIGMKVLRVVHDAV